MKIFGFTLWGSSKSSLTPLQEDFLNKYTSGIWKFNSQNGTVSVDGDFNCDKQNLDSLLGITFDFVTGNFSCANNNLPSLMGSPRKVGGNFDCTKNPLENLEGAPLEISGTFWSDFFGLRSVEWTNEGIKEARTRGPIAHKMIDSFVSWSGKQI